MVGIFPDRDALIRIVGAVLAEQHNEWIESRPNLDLDLIQRSQALGTVPSPVTNKEDPNTDLALSA